MFFEGDALMLSWNEMRERAYAFVNEWKDASSEDAEAKSFWDGFFNIFGISRRRVATFEERVKKIDGKDGYIDLLWKGVLLIEHKSRGKDLERAHEQAKSYFPGLKETDLPKYILVCDFERFRLYDLETNEKRNFTIQQLPQNLELFGFIAGYQKREYKEQDPVNIQAAGKMGQLHDKLKEIGYTGHALEVYLVRLLFCLFADDTGIFEKNLFRDYIEIHTKEDGSDLAFHFDAIFDILNKPKNSRLKTTSESLNQFPYVNGKLFEERLPPAAFNTEMRNLFLDCCALNWGEISPAVFGSLFQSVMNSAERRELGAHYTSESNILKVIKPLFLDDLMAEFESAKGSKKKLEQLHNKIAKLRFLDPACGCGNFLIIVYRELRLLEIAILKELTKGEFQRIAFLDHLIRVDVDQFYGIEIDEFPAQIAQVALWLTDHQMNMFASQEFGEYFARLPLKKKANIVHGNALKLDWHTIIRNTELSYILGNPPFLGARLMSKEQKEDMQPYIKDIKSGNDLDYVTAWFIKSAQYIKDANVRVGLVSTNSICQGEQATTLWKPLFNKLNVKIHFAHQTFRWNSEAKGKAAVFCVIVGFSCLEGLTKQLYSYPDVGGPANALQVKQINQYLLDAPSIFIESTKKPVKEGTPLMMFGSMLIDAGGYTFTEEEKGDFLKSEPLAEKFFRPYIGAREFINRIPRYCLYLKNATPDELRKMPKVHERIEFVREFRSKSSRPKTKEFSNYPTLFAEDRVPNSSVLVIPRVSSENRKYIPIGYLEDTYIPSEQMFQVKNASLYLFGILNSSMHMAWTRTVCGRLKGDYRYSNTIVYNNFIFPKPTDKQRQQIMKYAAQILDVRNQFPDSSLADLYDSLTMPPELMKAHTLLDKAVEKAYGKTFKTDAERVTHLFNLYTGDSQFPTSKVSGT